MSNVTLRTKGKRYKCRISENESHIVFNMAPFAFKNEIKAMKGARWFPEHRHWRVKNCPRNKFQFAAMLMEVEGEAVDSNPYAWFERPLVETPDSPYPLQDHQIDMVRKALTYRYQIFAADMGLGKTLTAIEIMRLMADQYDWNGDAELFAEKVWFVGPKSALESVEADLHKWKVPEDRRPRLMTYERLTIDHRSLPTPQCVFFDECSGLKSPGAQRTQAAQWVTDHIRKLHITDGCAILLSGTPTAKRPSDIWSQAEIAWPGFLREGSLKAFEDRYAIVVEMEDNDGNRFKKIEGWKDDEVGKLPSRLDGLMSVYRKDDILDLPKRTFTKIETPCSPRTARVARVLADSAPNVITALTRLRALSSGFQYTDDDSLSDNGDRAMVETACPKDAELEKYLEREETRGRMIAFASFQGSLDRVKRISQTCGWDVIMVDGRGWNCFKADGTRVKEHILDFWANNPNRTVLVGNPASCRFGLTLTEAKTIVVFDQNFSAEHRLQSLDRNYRIGQDEEVEVIDLLHLPVDGLILDTLTENKRLEDLSLGLLLSQLGGESTDSEKVYDSV